MQNVILGDKDLTLNEIDSIVYGKNSKIQLSINSWNRIRESSLFIDKIQQSEEKSYGINTSFGNLIDFNIPKNLHSELQKRLVLSHSVGVGKNLDYNSVKLLFFLRIFCLAKGASGVREETIKKLINVYNSGALPEISSRGSLGASGDLSPLSQFASFFLGKGFGYLNNKRLPSDVILKKIGVKKMVFDRKEGLSLINGTSAMTAIGIKVHKEFTMMTELFVFGMGMIMDSCQFSTSFLQTEAFKYKNFEGTSMFIKKLRKLLNKKIVSQIKSKNLQEVYSIRCSPFIVNPVIESKNYLSKILTIEANSINDNPIYLRKLNILYHGGHFHGLPVSFALDNARIGISILSNLIDRQLDYILDSKNKLNLPPFLSYSPENGYTGFAGAQYLVTSLAIENRNESNPYSNQSMPTNGGNQDLVSLGLQSGLTALNMLDNLRTIIYIYHLTAIQIYSLKSCKPRNSNLLRFYNKLTSISKFPYKEEDRFSTLLEYFMEENTLEKLVVQNHGLK